MKEEHPLYNKIIIKPSTVIEPNLGALLGSGSSALIKQLLGVNLVCHTSA